MGGAMTGVRRVVLHSIDVGRAAARRQAGLAALRRRRVLTTHLRDHTKPKPSDDELRHARSLLHDALSPPRAVRRWLITETGHAPGGDRDQPFTGATDLDGVLSTILTPEGIERVIPVILDILLPERE